MDGFPDVCGVLPGIQRAGDGETTSLKKRENSLLLTRLNPEEQVGLEESP
ncbi:MAG: hypothetical protein AAGA28_09500 [Pseudomonadota bacterium]